jgi:UDP-N-acetylglucosamine 2-epimerase (non-hydrolysing)
MGRSYMVMTDSGGIQEEAPSLGKPVLVMRVSTERHEGIEAGTARLVGVDYQVITTTAHSLLDNTDGLYDQMAHAINPYGDGDCSQRIADILLSRL